MIARDRRADCCAHLEPESRCIQCSADIRVRELVAGGLSVEQACSKVFGEGSA